MKNKLIVIAVLLASAIAFLCWWYSDKQVILRKTHDAIETLHLEKDAGRVSRTFKTEMLNNTLAPQLTISYPDGKFYFTRPDELEEPIVLDKSQAVSAHRYITEIVNELEITDISKNVIAIDDATARVSIRFTMRAKVQQKEEQTHTLNGVLTFTKTDNIWLISEANFRD